MAIDVRQLEMVTCSLEVHRWADWRLHAWYCRVVTYTRHYLHKPAQLMLQQLEDVLYGAVSPGVNVSRDPRRLLSPSPPPKSIEVITYCVLAQQPTVVFLNAALLACIALLVFLLSTSLVHNPPLAPHFAVLLVFAVGLLASVNWCAQGACRLQA